MKRLLSRFKNIVKQFPFVAPKMVYSCKQWIDKKSKRTEKHYSARKDWYKLIEEVEYHHHSLPLSIEPVDKSRFDQNISYKTDEAYLFSLKNTFVYRDKGLIISNFNDCFLEFSHHFNIYTLKKFLLKNPFYTYSNKEATIQGTGAVLISPESFNYYHWMFDVLPRIKLYSSVLDQVDHFCVSSLVPQKFLDVLPAFGIPKEKILVVNDNEKLKFDNLFVASLPGSEGRSPKWAVEFVREKLLSNISKTTSTKKLYFKRGNAAQRRVLNEQEIIEILVADGFEIIEPETLSIQEQAMLVNGASVIIGAHGAALSNIIFAPAGHCTVIEIFSPDYFRTDCFYTLSGTLNVNYWYITGKKPQHANWGEIIVDEEALKKTLADTNYNTYCK